MFESEKATPHSLSKRTREVRAAEKASSLLSAALSLSGTKFWVQQ